MKMGVAVVSSAAVTISCPYKVSILPHSAAFFAYWASLFPDLVLQVILRGNVMGPNEGAGLGV